MFITILLCFCTFTVLFAQNSLSPNLIRNSYMDILDGAVPAGFSVSGNLTLTAVHPYTKGFEGPYLPSAPAGAAVSVDDATQQNPFWYGAYNKGPRVYRGGLADGWLNYPGGKILKITGDNTGASTMMYFPFERNVLTSKLRLRAWIKIVAGESVSFGTDAGLANIYWGGYTLLKATADAGPNGWYYIDQVINTSRTTSLTTNVFSMGLKGSNIEVYLALPYLSVLEDQTWLPSVADMLNRDGLFIHPQTQNVGIGTKDTKGYKLAVNGDAVFTKIKVKTFSAWPDYVFHPEYKLAPLNDVEAFIKKHRHLPEIPSALEVEQNGQDLGAMNGVLLKKVEELTLYMIEMKKEIDSLKKIIYQNK